MSEFEKELENITAQMCECVDSEFLLRVSTDHESVSMQKLVMLVNFTVDSTQRALNELMYNNKHLEQIVQNRTFELRLEKDKAEQANIAKDQFIANISHELRTPLNGIMGVTQILEKSATDKRTAQLVSVIKNSSDHLLHILNDILDLSKINSGKMTLENIPFCLDAEIKNALNWFMDSANQKSLSINFQSDINQNAYYTGDPTRLKQVLANLLNNAIKFTPNNGRVSIEVREEETTTTNQKLVYISISDTGIGMSKEVQNSIFDAFTQADNSTTRQYGGTGLGLTICQKLVKEMSGEIKLESEEEQGTTFIVKLPLSHTEERKAEKSTSTDENTRQSKSESAYLLLAEDNPTNQLVAQEILQSYGYVVEIANDGHEAVEKANEHYYDMILMDCHMPNKNGFDAALELRQQHGYKNPIIALTADLNADTKQQVYQSGMSDFVSKPFHGEHLNHIIQNHLSAKKCDEKIKQRKVQMLDEKVVEKLEATVFGTDENLFTKIARTYIEHSSKLVEDIVNGAQMKDREKVFHAAHSLKSSSATIGAMNVSEYSEHIETLSHKNPIDWPTIEQTATQLEQDFQTVIELLKIKLEE